MRKEANIYIQTKTEVHKRINQLHVAGTHAAVQDMIVTSTEVYLPYMPRNTQMQIKGHSKELLFIRLRHRSTKVKNRHYESRTKNQDQDSGTQEYKTNKNRGTKE